MELANKVYSVCNSCATAEVVLLPGTRSAVRFCQQCRKLHNLKEFKDSLRSCRVPGAASQSLVFHNAVQRAARTQAKKYGKEQVNRTPFPQCPSPSTAYIFTP